MIAERSGRDWTMAMTRFAAIRTNELAELKLSGYVFKKISPSCGVERVRVYDPENMPARRGRGLFAAAVMTRIPSLPLPVMQYNLNAIWGARFITIPLEDFFYNYSLLSFYLLVYRLAGRKTATAERRAA